MPRYAPRMPQADLRQLLVDKALKNDFVEQYGDLDPASPDMTRIVHMLLMEELLADVEKDWAKIDFSTENMDVKAEKTTPDGVPYLQIEAGGDWETQLVCILYFDGKKMRGYVPKDGNTYNHARKAAFGNSDDDDSACARQFGSRHDHEGSSRDIEPDISLVERDIASRIEARGTHSHTARPITSKAKEKAAKQARIERGQDLSGPLSADMVYAVISLAAGCSYVEFELRSSRRTLTVDEGERLIGVPAVLTRTVLPHSGSILWYAPFGCYPARTHAILEAAGFAKAPDNDISMYQNARTVVIGV